MTKIFFAGDMRSPFIQEDAKLLKEDHEVSIFDITTNFIHFPFHIFKCFQQVLNIRNSDLVWIWFADIPALPIMIISKLFHKPTVVNVGGFEVSGIPEINYGNQLKPIRGWISRWIIRNASAVIIPSPIYEEKIKNLIPTANVYMIPNFIDTSMCDTQLPQKEDIVVTAVCSKFAYDYKGIPMFQRVSNMIPYKSIILEHLPREEYINTLKRAKVYCQLSRDETFGISLVEAMACGCVPVVSDKGALPWIVGDCGIVVPYGNFIYITADAIERAMTMDGSKARERARYFSREKKQSAVKYLIREILKPNMNSSCPSEPFEV
jgi:glycosyltransferase involved in cell wall biosynthesis